MSSSVGTLRWLRATLQERVFSQRLDETVFAIGVAWARAAAAESPELSFSALTRSEIEERIGCSGVAALLQILATRPDGSGHLITIERDERFGTLFIVHGVLRVVDGETLMSLTRGATSAVRGKHRNTPTEDCP